MYLLGYDIGSSSIKASLVDTDKKEVIITTQSPETELNIHAPQSGWAEQHPEIWWEHLCLATRNLLQQAAISSSDIKGIGISYQMHGLVMVDKAGQALRPSIIWCDSRAVEIGRQAFDDLGEETCLRTLLNSPGNFTAAKLKWVQTHEPAIYERIHKIMLPGDYIAMRLTGETITTPSGLSEGIFWDFEQNKLSDRLMDYFGFDPNFIPTVQATFSPQGQLTAAAAQATGLSSGIPVSYRAGDQPNNALSLNVLQPGEVAGTGGTSGVVYGVVDQPNYDPQSRVNSFAHVNHQPDQPRIGVLLCINGAGIQYSWLRQNLTQNALSYQKMNALAATVAVGSDGLRILPFGNGAERMLCNQDPGASINNLQFNRHTNAHLYRASLEGIAFSFVHGIHILQAMGLDISVMRVGNDNLFRSAIFSQTIANLLGCSIELVNTTGASGAAKAAGVATGIYSSIEEAMQGTKVVKTYQAQQTTEPYQAAFSNWSSFL